ncbi:hypothetical protein GGR26_003149 [Lewinella marina]|uniref:Uncharacterized protein n=1 Tax=Neolewinella marina TaxID=438751 RepID=A0A2G0CEB0_9BACT|nr:hypothetical protein [Neolewinella marina]NJB87369.1 hypothetical protein [Neolewinella marina]PHK98316.1 hypothetical protein CGL56_11485 [Neolewinella marina]
MRPLLLALLSIVLLSGCPRSSLGERLFDINYPVINFTIPAGQPSFQTFVVAQPRLETRFQEQLDASGFTADDVDLVGGIRARVTSLSGEDFREIERMELRVCPVSSPNGCTFIDLMFSIDDLGGRRQQTVNLNPGEKNFRNVFLENEEVRMELVITPFDVTTQNIDARLEWTIGAVGGL